MDATSLLRFWLHRPTHATFARKLTAMRAALDDLASPASLQASAGLQEMCAMHGVVHRISPYAFPVLR